MIPYFHKTPGWLMKWFPSMTWQRPASEKSIYLTFDDGPIPQVTPYVLDVLTKYDAKATFFCVGDNIRKHPDVFQAVLKAGQSVGNHTYHHLNGWNTPTHKFWTDIEACKTVMEAHGAESRLFRPPHGRIRKEQRIQVEQEYEIIMWSHLSGDFDPGLNVGQSAKSMKSAAEGSILVFHDSIKAAYNLKKLLPEIMSYFSDQGFEFKSL
tara:strand:- start:1197 stop:1823 length:627 start_codon:yes stop_codon:yes gene_type:complete